MLVVSEEVYVISNFLDDLFTVYLMTLPAAQIIQVQRQMIALLSNIELKKMWKERGVP
jgi:hypothetical protein